ncbi:MAG: SDR family NAD(P)-dependent oxidoreductase [Candidatus Cloacimonetes bacterium]|nr:SDR family NAD(P)-dependent oxidoreductase [Candidatus Cloacimonadota bacterium]
MILVTGAAGFIGSHLCDRLVGSGHTVVGLDNFNPFYNPQIKRNNISTLLTHPLFQLWEADIRDSSALDQCFAANDFDLVIHLAAMAGVRPSIEDPEEYYDVNVTGTVKLLQQCVRSRVRRFLFASSSSVYGNNDKIVFSETDHVDHPISPYAATKKAGELICHHYHHLNRMSVICLRFFTVYGPRQRPDLAVHSFVHRIMNGLPIPFFGDGSTSRDYSYIDDIIEGVTAAADYLDNHHCYEIINLGNSDTITLTQMLKTIEAVTGCPAIIDRQPLQAGDALKTCADIHKARALLAYQPKTAFEAGVRTFFDWYLRPLF